MVRVSTPSPEATHSTQHLTLIELASTYGPPSPHFHRCWLPFLTAAPIFDRQGPSTKRNAENLQRACREPASNLPRNCQDPAKNLPKHKTRARIGLAYAWSMPVTYPDPAKNLYYRTAFKVFLMFMVFNLFFGCPWHHVQFCLHNCSYFLDPPSILQNLISQHGPSKTYESHQSQCVRKRCFETLEHVSCGTLCMLLFLFIFIRRPFHVVSAARTVACS